MKHDSNKLAKAAQRQSAIEQNFYDGRFRSKVVPNKKAIISKKAARKKVSIEY